MELSKKAEILHDVLRGLRVGVGELVENKYADESEAVKKEHKDLVLFVESNPDMRGPSDIHEEWLKGRLAKGYVFGKSEDSNIKTSPMMLRFNDLNDAHKCKYHLIRNTVLALIKA